jgi:hypothetical protein
MASASSSTKSIPEKLQMKPGRTISIINQPPNYKQLLGELPRGVSIQSQPSKPVDIIQVFVESRQQLERQLPSLKNLISPKGMIWVTYPKGTSTKKADINRDSIADYAQTIGLEGIAIVAIDVDWSALRLKVVG